MTIAPNGTDIRLHTRALLVWLTLSSWSGHKFDREITSKVNRDLQTSTDAGRYNKHLLKNSANLKSLQSLIGTIRTEHYQRTLAWSDEGWRLLTNANFLPFTDWFRKQSAALDRAVDAFIDGYDDDVLNDRLRLNGSFASGDYPSAVDLRQRFSVKIAYMPITAEGDVRVDLAAEHVAAVESSVRDQLTANLQNAMSDAWARLGDVVAKMADKLSAPDSIFRDTLVTNVRETCDMLTRLNVTDDPCLEAMRASVQQNLAQYDAQSLREYPRVRSFVASKAQELLDQMKANGVL